MTMSKMRQDYITLEADRDAQQSLAEHAQAKLAAAQAKLAEAQVKLAQFHTQHPHYT